MLQGVSQRVLNMSGGGGVGVAGVLEDVVHQKCGCATDEQDQRGFALIWI